MSALLKLVDVDVYYGDAHILRQVSLEVGESDLVSVMGPNGTGKTTMLKTIAGVLLPRAGRVEWRGETVRPGDVRGMVRRGVVLVPEGRHVFASLTVRENLLVGAFTRRSAAGVRADIDVLCDTFPVLRAKRDAPASMMSGGEQQMLAIARGLMSRPRLLLLDEPSLGLSPLIIGQLPDTFARVQESFGTAVLLVEQNLSLACTAPRGYLISGGRMVFSGPMDEVRDLVDRDGPFVTSGADPGTGRPG